MKNCGTSEAVYGLGFIGAVIYYLQHAPTFWIGVLGILKAMVWPAFLIYRVLEFFKM
jgi:hypothetical protein